MSKSLAAYEAYVGDEEAGAPLQRRYEALYLIVRSSVKLTATTKEVVP